MNKLPILPAKSPLPLSVEILEQKPKAFSALILLNLRDFNSQNEDQILRVGILPDDLELKKLKPEAAFRIIREEYEMA